jgi:nitronate monooxygenase
MLEAERAGAKALVVYLDSYPRNSSEWKVLRQVQADEAHNCALIGKLLEKSGTPYSHATGGFFEKAISIEGKEARIAFLVRGLRWAVKRFEEAFPRLSGADRDAFTRMRDSHLRTIAACEALAQTLPR